MRHRFHAFILAPVAAMLLTACSFSFVSSKDSAISTKQTTATVECTLQEEDRFLHVEGTDILNQDGEKIYLRGTNAGGLFVQESWMVFTSSPDLLNTYNVIETLYGEGTAFELLDVYENSFWKEEDFQNCKDLGFNALRLPISYMDVYETDFALLYQQPTAEQLRNLPLTVREKHLQKIDKFILDARKYGLYVILDLHGAFGSQNGNDHSIDSRQHDWLWNTDETGEEYRNLNVKLWKQLATRYKDFDNIAAYDLMNEPAGDNSNGTDNTTTTGKIQWDHFDTLYKEIRAIDPRHIIIIESCWDASNLPNPSQYGWENIVYQYHHYEWSNQDDDEFQYNSHLAKVRNLVSANYGVPIYMGEFRVFGSDDCSAFARVINLYNENNLHWTTWTYKVKGWSNWGLYCVPNWEDDQPKAAIIRSVDNCDDFFVIREKWEAQRNGQTRNDVLCDAIVNALQKANKEGENQ